MVSGVAPRVRVVRRSRGRSNDREVVAGLRTGSSKDLRSVVLRDFLAHDEDSLVQFHLLGHGLVQSLSHGHLLGLGGISSPRQRRGGDDDRSECRADGLTGRGRARRGEKGRGRAEESEGCHVEGRWGISDAGRSWGSGGGFGREETESENGPVAPERETGRGEEEKRRLMGAIRITKTNVRRRSRGC